MKPDTSSDSDDFEVQDVDKSSGGDSMACWECKKSASTLTLVRVQADAGLSHSTTFPASRWEALYLQSITIVAVISRKIGTMHSDMASFCLYSDTQCLSTLITIIVIAIVRSSVTAIRIFIGIWVASIKFTRWIGWVAYSTSCHWWKVTTWGQCSTSLTIRISLGSRTPKIPYVASHSAEWVAGR
jgi:hypothetical protein